MREFLDRATAWSVIERHTELLRLLRRHPAQEHDGEPGRREPAPVRDHLRRGEGARRRVRAAEPDARRSAGVRRTPSGSRSCRAATSPSCSASRCTLVDEALADRAFLDRYCAGFDRFERYLLGADDGTSEDAGVGRAALRNPAATIRALARRMAAKRTLINAN